MEWFFIILLITALSQILGGLSPFIAMDKFKKHVKRIILIEVLMMTFLSLELIYIALNISYIAVIGIFLGMIVIKIFDGFIRHRHIRSEQEISTLVFIAMCIHEIPEGVAFASSYIIGGGSGFITALLMCLHNIPEGSVVALPLLQKGRLRKSIELLGITQVAYVAGALLAFFLLLSMDERIKAISLCFAAGCMLFISAKEMRLLWK